MSRTLSNTSKSPKKPAIKAKTGTAKKKTGGLKARKTSASAKTKTKRTAAKKDTAIAVGKGIESWNPAKQSGKKAAAVKKTPTRKSAKVGRSTNTKTSKKATFSRVKAEKNSQIKADKNLIPVPNPIPEVEPERMQAKSQNPEQSMPVEPHMTEVESHKEIRSKSIIHDAQAHKQTARTNTQNPAAGELFAKEEQEKSRVSAGPFARIMKLVRRPEKAPETDKGIAALEHEEEEPQIDLMANDAPIAETVTQAEAIVDRVAVLLDAISKTSVEMESRILAETESGQEAVYDPSNLLMDSVPRTAVQTETETACKIASEEESEKGLRFSLDTFFREDRVTPAEDEEPAEDSEAIAPVLAEVGDIYQNTEDKDLIAEIDNNPDESKENNNRIEFTEDEAEEELASQETVEEDNHESKENILKEPQSESKEPETLPNKVVLLRSAEDVRPQIDTPDFSDRRKRPRHPWTLDVEIALRDLMGDVPDPSRIDFDQMVMAWKRGYESYFSTSLADYRFPYVWADFTEMNLGEGIKKTFLSFTGCDLRGRRKLLSLIEGDPESAEIWQVMLKRLERRDLGNPRLFIGKSDLALWEVLPKVFPRARAQYCWNDFTRKLKAYIPQDFHENAVKHINRIRHAPGYLSSESCIEDFKASFGTDYPHAVIEVMKCKQDLLRYYSYPSKHWNYIKTSGKICAFFPTEVLMKTVCKFEKMRDVSLYLIFNYLLRSQRRWPRFKGIGALKRVQTGRRYFDGQKKPRRGNKMSPATADKKNTGNLLQKMTRRINSGFGSLLSKPRKSKRTYITHSEAGQSKAGTEAIAGTAGKDNASNPKAELEDLLRDRMGSEKNSGPQAIPAAVQVLEKIRSGNKPEKIFISGMEREIMEEINTEK